MSPTARRLRARACIVGLAYLVAPPGLAQEAPPLGSAAEVPYPPLSDFPCKTGADVIIDVGYKVATACAARAGEKVGDYLAFIPQAIFAALVPVTREWLAAEVISKLTKDGKACLLKGVLEGMGATPETVSLVTDGYTQVVSAQGQDKFIGDMGKFNDLFAAARKHGDKFVMEDETLRKSLQDFQKFSFLANKKLESQVKAAKQPVSTGNSFFAWWDQYFHPADSKARRAVADAQKAVAECDVAGAAQSLQAAQTLNREWLGVLRKEISRARKAVYCEEDRIGKNPLRGLKGDDPFLVASLRGLKSDLDEYEKADLTMVTYMGEVAGLEEKLRAEGEKLEQASRQNVAELDQASAAIKSCDLDVAQRHLDAVGERLRNNRCNQMTQTGPTPMSEEFTVSRHSALEGEVGQRRRQAAQDKQDAQDEYEKVMAFTPSKAGDCADIETVAVVFERKAAEDTCFNAMEAGAKATSLRNKAQQCRLAMGDGAAPPVARPAGGCDPADLNALLGTWYDPGNRTVTVTGSCERIDVGWEFSPRYRPNDVAHGKIELPCVGSQCRRVRLQFDDAPGYLLDLYVLEDSNTAGLSFVGTGIDDRYAHLQKCRPGGRCPPW